VRWGGEEFALLLPETDLPQAQVMAERLRLAFEASDVRLRGGGRLRVTASFGVADYPASPDRASLLAIAGAADYAAKRRGKVSIALLPSLAAGWLPAVLADFRARYPNIELDVADVLSDDCIQRVRAGRADFALASTRAEAPELHTEAFCSDGFHVVFRHDHALARRRGSLTLADLAPHPIVQLARSSSVRQYVEAAIYPNRLRTVLELEQLSTVAGMVRAGMGLTIVPSLTLFHFQHAELTTRALRVPGLVRQVFLVRRSDRGLSSAAQALHEVVMRQRPGRVARAMASPRLSSTSKTTAR